MSTFKVVYKYADTEIEEEIVAGNMRLACGVVSQKLKNSAIEILDSDVKGTVIPIHQIKKAEIFRVQLDTNS
ncbi:hypothetical protein [Armatimonas sp.]|uniref:hypothetical protein n=1 Tax=Armatimonas sp. TaxID=1872638 RepID=UPI00286A5B9A|nr:hypothetical protein [Armatimonas sp.]